MMDSFVLLVYVSLAASRTFSQQLLVCLNFVLDSDLFYWYKQKCDFYQLWQQHKHLKASEMSKAWPETYKDEYINQFQPEPTHKIH